MTVLAAPLVPSSAPGRGRDLPPTVTPFRVPAPRRTGKVLLPRPVLVPAAPLAPPAVLAPAPTAPAPTAPVVPAAAPATAPTDWAARLQRGDRDSWTELLARFGPLVTASARRVLADPADVDEAVQRTWLAVWRHADAVRDVDRLPGWLRVTARREGLALLRRRRDVLVGDVAVLDRAVADGGPAVAVREVAEDAQVAVERRHRAADLHAAIDRLPLRQRRLVRALLSDSLSYDEISETLGIPRGSIGPMRGRALVALRRMLADWED